MVLGPSSRVSASYQSFLKEEKPLERKRKLSPVLKEAITACPETWEFKRLRRQWMKKYWLLENNMRVQGKDDKTINRIMKSGQLERVAPVPGLYKRSKCAAGDLYP